MIDLHCHLDGSLPFSAIPELARLSGLPYDSRKNRLTLQENCRSLDDFLACFSYPVSLLQSFESIAYASEALFVELAHEGILYAEVRYAPQLSLERGLSQKEVTVAMIEGYQRAHQKTGILGSLILCLMRGEKTEALNQETIAVAHQFLNQGVSGVDLAGPERAFPTRLYAKEFALAKRLGIPITIHAGEDAGADSVKEAVALGATRIGHGIHAIEDQELLKELANKGVVLEICPTSECDTHCIPSLKALPLREFLSAGIAVTLGHDDRTISGTTLQKEYQKLERTFALTPLEATEIIHQGVSSAFLDGNDKAKLSALVDEALRKDNPFVRL